ncbi:hypothetical protein [Streptomyces sp. NPDC001292]|uniref:hypothetical protein n=1 Tax=Streptomyces sp. NPDC001292 TaxID=3364558 RepID=UPI0036C824A0
MAVRDIAYVELYTSNRQSVADHFISAMGFARTADWVGVDRSSVLLRQGEVSLLITTGPVTWRFLDTYGDGIADVALVCDDVGETLEAALAADAVTADSLGGNPALSGAGGVVHTLLPPGGVTASGLPSGRTWVPEPGAPLRPEGPIRGLDHVGLRPGAGTPGTCADFYRDALGFSCLPSGPAAGRWEERTDTAVVRGPCGRVILAVADGDPYLAFRTDGSVPAVCTFPGGGVVESHEAVNHDRVAYR